MAVPRSDSPGILAAAALALAPTPGLALAQGLGRRTGGTEATVFGLDVRAELSLSFLQRARASPTGRTLDVCGSKGDGSGLGWPDSARTICHQRRSDGTVYFRIEAHPEAGYLIWGEGRGSYLLSPDGQRLCCAANGAPAQTWERFLVGQVLPFAALLSGLEIFHASAVVLDGRAVAFVGPSGAGKTSVALECCRRGAGFLADDVLALQAREHGLLAQPGAPVAGVDQREVRRLRDAGRPLEQEVLGVDAREQLIRMDGALGPAPLGALFFLDRSSKGSGEPRFQSAADARMLLASTFNFVLDTPQRMCGLLNVCALAAGRPVERIVLGPSVDAGGLAQAVISHLDRAAA